MKLYNLSRRRFLQGTAAVGATGLLIGCSANVPEVQLQSAAIPPVDELNNWLFIGTDNHIIVTIPAAEMGQGVNTSLAQVVADELDADWDLVEVRQAPLNSKFANAMGMQMTGGSMAIKDYFMPMREVGAAAKQMIIKAAAAQLGTDISQLKAEQSHILWLGKRYPYADFVAAAATLPAPENVTLKSQAQRTLIGTPVAHKNSRERITGEAGFGIDVNVPDMLNAAIVQAPIFGTQAKAWDEQAALAVTGVQKVLVIDNALIVVANKYWQAKKGAEALQASFGSYQQDLPGRNTDEVRAAYTAALNEQGKEQPAGSHVLDVEYSVPWLAHATMEPMNCTAWVQADCVDLWLPTQAQTVCANVAKQLTGLDEEQIHVHNQLLGGGFGRRSEGDFVAQAIKVSTLMQRPVKLIWSREQDMQHDFYRPMVISRFQIGLNDEYQPVAWHNQIASTSILKRVVPSMLPKGLKWLPLTSVIGDPIITEGASDIPYLPEGEDADMQLSLVESNVPVGFWRSVGHSSNAFFTESVIDEAANLGKLDPYQYRSQLLVRSPREKAVLDLAASKANWGHAPAGRFHGIAVEFGSESYTAMVVELSLEQGAITIHKVTCAVDCGQVVNPNGAVGQIEGGINFAISAAMQGEITVEDGRVQQSNFHDYPIMRLAQSPTIEVHLVPSNEQPTGLGEVGVPPLAPALCNALVAAGKPRIRSLPLSKHGYHLA